MCIPDSTIITIPAEDVDEPEGDLFADVLVAVDIEGRGVVLGFFNTVHNAISEDFDSLWGDYSSKKAWEGEPGLYRVKANFISHCDYYGKVDCGLEVETIQPLVLADPALLQDGWSVSTQRDEEDHA